ncbi:hypothetical protein BG261_11010 [Floricoccus tropicus]|uniref:Capsular biosynthesis protein n=1 Tax=Floricoccus tropicus TaxID=1859473 RepID=A0A1E8GLY3_9LACT|nr:hypothetical protein [Floricoccus tropicus]OFI49269.1 hypothetical protein BG261_11010 [Floricoccus tropicus]
MEIALILNTKKISSDMSNRFGEIYPLDLPFKNTNIKNYLLEQYSTRSSIFIANESSENHELDIINHKLYNEVLLSYKKSDSILEVIYQSLSRIINICEGNFSFVVNFGDTIIDDLPQRTLNDYIIVGKRDKYAPWTSVVKDKNKLIFIDKESISADKNENLVAGVFKFSDAYLLLNIIEKYRNDNNNINHHSFYDIIEKYNSFIPMSLVNTTNWWDFGHEYEYLETKKIVKARYFNEIDIDTKRGILTKRSKDVEKFIGEILWYIKIPNELQYMIPRIYTYSIDSQAPFVSMEYYPYETLHNLYIFGRLELNEWKKIISKLFFVKDEMSIASPKNIKLSVNDLKSIYIDKTMARHKKLMENDYFKKFLNEDVIINEIVYPSLNEIIKDLSSKFEQFGILENREAKIIHGDYCISNILYDVDSQLIKLIDPRGKFGTYDIYGDELYDIAKILHSFDGSYDHIINDDFTITEIEDNGFNYSINKSELQNQITNLLIDKISERYNLDQVRLIEGTLFLSMIPLHADYPERQKIMYGQAMKLLSPYYREGK